MAAHDWYRNATWNESIAAAFDAKLKRARDKNQYLRIQASYLAATHPEAALRLLDRYFELGEHFDHAQAHVDRAAALTALGQHEAAADSYLAALQREKEHPHLKTSAFVQYPYHVAVRSQRAHYERALDVLATGKEETFLTPVAVFWWYAASALILSDMGRSDKARKHAALALEAASQKESGLPYHPILGLVSAAEAPVLERLQLLG